MKKISFKFKNCRLLLPVAMVAILATSCGGDSSSTAEDSSNETTEVAAEPALDSPAASVPDSILPVIDTIPVIKNPPPPPPPPPVNNRTPPANK